MTITNQLGIRNSNTIIPLTAATRQTKQVTVTINTSGWVAPEFYAIFYADSLGVWRMRFNAIISKSSGTVTADTAITLVGVTFANISDNQSISGFLVEAGVALRSTKYMIAKANTSQIQGGTLNGTDAYSAFSISGDVVLKEEPIAYTIAANMEGVVAVDVFVPAAAAGIQGLVDNRVANTLGTPILGKTDGAAVAAGYVGEERISVTGLTSVSGSAWQNLDTLTLKKGRYSLSGVVIFNLNSATMTAAAIAISVNSATGTGDHVSAKNVADGLPPTADANSTLSVSNYIINVSVDDTPYYLKAYPVYSAGTPRTYSRFNAVRIA